MAFAELVYYENTTAHYNFLYSIYYIFRPCHTILQPKFRDIKAGDELLYHYDMSYWAKERKVSERLAAEHPYMVDVENTLKGTWREKVAEKLAQLIQIDKTYRQHDFRTLYDINFHKSCLVLLQ